MIDPDGVEWLPVSEAAARVGVQPSLIYVWLSRGTVRGHKISGRKYVPMPAVLDAEHAWRARPWGHQHAARKGPLA